MPALRTFLGRLALVAMLIGTGSCVGDATIVTDVPVEGAVSPSLHAPAPPAPADLVDVAGLDVWPWTGRDLSETIADPLNLIFRGDVDVVSLRAALLALDGDRTAFDIPNVPPFNCTWKDAHGGMQTAYTGGAGWVGNAVQLECGDYAPVRFHIRLFDAGSWVVGAVHFDLLIPGTPQHQVLSWEVPQQLVTVDLARTGLLGALPSFVPVGPAQGVQSIPKPIYDGIPPGLKAAFGLPPGDAPAAGVPILSDGVATLFELAARADVVPGTTSYELSVPFDQVVPRPFCSSGPTDFVLLRGPVDISVHTRVNDLGALESHNVLGGELAVTPIDISTGLPSGDTFRARISQIDNTGVAAEGTRVNAVQLRKALPPGVGFLKAHLVTGPNGAAHFTTSEKCQ